MSGSAIKDLEAVIYVRNSNKIDNQLNRCGDFVELNNLTIKHLFSDSSESLSEAPAFVQMKSYLQSHPNTVVITASADRITRDAQDMMVFLGFLQQHNCYLVCIEEKMDTTTALGEKE